MPRLTKPESISLFTSFPPRSPSAFTFQSMNQTRERRTPKGGEARSQGHQWGGGTEQVATFSHQNRNKQLDRKKSEGAANHAD